jgi:PKD repeat protein
MDGRLRAKGLRALALILPVLALAIAPGDASAASQTLTPTFAGSGSNTEILSALAVCDPCAPDAFFEDPTHFIKTWGLGAGATIKAQASWSNPSTIGLQYSAGNLRHGATLDLSDTLTPGAGTLKLDYSVTALVGLYGTPQEGNLSCAVVVVSNASCNGWVPTTDTTEVGPIKESDTIPCTMPLPGDSPRTCSKTKSITLWKASLFEFASAEVKLILDESVTVTGSGVSSVRIAVIDGGQSIPNRTLTFGGGSPSTVADPIQIGCSQPVGNDLLYSLTSNEFTAEPATYSGDVKLGVKGEAFGFGGEITTEPLVSSTGADLGPIPLSAPEQQVDLGPVLANNVPPTPNAGGPYEGVEGSPITFNGTGSTSVCGLSNLTLVWKFSDGGVAYGAEPQHTFLAPGTYSGLLTVTDADGNVATTTFSVSVANLPPVANAGPNMSSEWGVPVTLNGSAVDPGTNEQPFLTYNWSFGDGSPSASGGASVTHTYVAPGTYTATFTACDPENACGPSTTQVVVSKRATTTSYTGPNKSTPSKDVTLSATIVDDQGQPVAGRLVTFTLGSQSIGAMTSSSGVASATLKLNQKKGTYTVTATFAPESSDKYTGSSGGQTFTIGP